MNNANNSKKPTKPKAKSKRSRPARQANPPMPKAMRGQPLVAAQPRMSRLRATPYFGTKAPTRKGATARYVGCDYIGVLTASTSVNDIFKSAVSPGNTTLFPRLSAMAPIFQKYAFNKLRAYIVGDASSTQGGAITAVPCYESSGTPSSLTVAQARNREQQETRKFWEDFTMDFDCGKATVPWFIAAGAAGASGVVAYFGELHIVADLVATAVAVGQLYIEYDVEFAEAVVAGDPEIDLSRVQLSDPLCVRTEDGRPVIRVGSLGKVSGQSLRQA